MNIDTQKRKFLSGLIPRPLAQTLVWLAIQKASYEKLVNTVMNIVIIKVGAYSILQEHQIEHYTAVPM